MLVEFDIDINALIGYDLPCDTFAQRFKKAIILAGLSQRELAKMKRFITGYNFTVPEF